jgi:hypothetical protein
MRKNRMLLAIEKIILIYRYRKFTAFMNSFESIICGLGAARVAIGLKSERAIGRHVGIEQQPRLPAVC